jgi:hypothetical protein
MNEVIKCGIDGCPNTTDSGSFEGLICRPCFERNLGVPADVEIKALREEVRVWTANAKLYDKRRMKAEQQRDFNGDQLVAIKGAHDKLIAENIELRSKYLGSLKIIKALRDKK